jgi:hypothetical protein
MIIESERLTLTKIKKREEKKMSEDNIMKFPIKEKVSRDIKLPEKGEGLKTINELRKKVSAFDINNIFNTDEVIGGYGGNSLYDDKSDLNDIKSKPNFVLNLDLFNKQWNKKTDKYEYKIGLTKEKQSRYNWRNSKTPSAVRKMQEIDKSIEVSVLNFSGGKGNYGTHTDFTKCKVIIDSNRGNILYIQYGLDDTFDNEPHFKTTTKFFKNWLRSTVDTSIANNWNELHSVKDFDLIVETKTYEKISVKGLDRENAINNAKKKDPTLNFISGRYQGERTILEREDIMEYISFKTRKELLKERS